jgi:serine/threonine protein kinase
MNEGPLWDNNQRYNAVSDAISHTMDLAGKERIHIPHHRSDTIELEASYKIFEVIGQGSFGVVTRVEHIQTRTIYASKAIKKRPGIKSMYEQIMREVDILKAVSHPGIISLHEVYESSKQIVLIME